MRSSLKKLWAILAIMALLFVVVGCQTADNNGAQQEGDESENPVENGEENGADDEEETELADTIVLATTTSTYDSGLLQEILPLFESEYGIEVDVISVGTGQAIEIGERGDCDIILVHARNLEDEFVAEGYGTERWDVMYNDFVFLGPVGDPGALKESAGLTEALQKMVEHMNSKGISFLSRGDNSGTHNKELSLWALADIDIEGEEWYNSLGQGMGDTLIAANEMQGYTLTDRGTYLAMSDNLPNLEIVFEGDESLANPYGIIPVNPEKHPGVHHEEAMLLVEFFISDEIQEAIGEFGKDTFGQSLFFPNAK
ncbi:MAG: substrate-binding domain-containing protein [Dethiobacteria bacterium]